MILSWDENATQPRRKSMSKDSRTAEKALFFTLGAFIGATVALLLAPRSGEETRRIIASKAREGADYVSRGGRNVMDKTTSFIDRWTDVLQQQREPPTAAPPPGKH